MYAVKTLYSVEDLQLVTRSRPMASGHFTSSYDHHRHNNDHHVTAQKRTISTTVIEAIEQLSTAGHSYLVLSSDVLEAVSSRTRRGMRQKARGRGEDEAAKPRTRRGSDIAQNS